MSVAEIIQELPKLSPEDRLLLRQELEEKFMDSFEETPEMLAAIGRGVTWRASGVSFRRTIWSRLVASAGN